jgi:hypothetical protein
MSGLGDVRENISGQKMSREMKKNRREANRFHLFCSSA